MTPVHVLLLGVGLLAALFLIGGSIQASAERAARRGKPIPHSLLGGFLKALQAAPDREVSTWYDLGVILSRLSHRKEAAVAFQYVLRHGEPTSREVGLARQWLATAAPVSETARLDVLDGSRTVLAPLRGEPAGNGRSSRPEDRPLAYEQSTRDEATTATVIHYADGRVLKGLSYDFHPDRPVFRLFPPFPGLSLRDGPIQVAVKDLKAVFFVRNLVGDRSYMERKDFAKGERPPGRRVEVTFLDGEVLAGFAMEYDPQRPGFFFVPADPKSNNLKVFAVRTAVARIRFPDGL